MGLGDMWDGLVGNVEDERRAAARRLQRERECSALLSAPSITKFQREQAYRDRYDADMSYQQAETERARREADRVAREKRENEQRLIREQREMEAHMLRQHNQQMQRAHEENISEMRRANAEKDVINREHRRREMDIIRANEEKQERASREAAERVDKLTEDFSKTIEEKNKELLQTKETMHAEKITLMEKSEQEKNELQKEHLENLNENQRKFLEQQKLTQDKFDSETAALRSDAKQREELLREEKAAAEADFQRQMKEQELMSKEEREATQNRHENYIRSKDAAIEKLREETESRVEALQEANCLQQAADLATLEEIEHQRIEREKEVHAQLMDIGQKNLEERAELYEKMAQEKDKSNAMLFLAMKQQQDDTHQYQQILNSLPRVLASEQQTSQLMSLKTKLHEMTSNTDDTIITFGMAFDDFSREKAKRKESTRTFAALEKSATDMNATIGLLNRTLDSCTSVIAATRNEWRGLLRTLQQLTSAFTRFSARMLGSTKRKSVTLEAIAALTVEFHKIKEAIYDLPNLNEGSAMGMVQQRQAAIVQAQEARLNMLSLAGGPALPSLQGPQDPF